MTYFFLAKKSYLCSSSKLEIVFLNSNSNNTTNWLLFFQDRAKTENAKRLLHVEKVCEEYNLGKYKVASKPIVYKEPPTPHYEIFFYDRYNFFFFFWSNHRIFFCWLKIVFSRTHKLSWCPIYKAGSSTWLYNFAILGSSTDEEIAKSNLQINEFVRKLYPAFSSEEAIAVSFAGKWLQ